MNRLLTSYTEIKGRERQRVGPRAVGTCARFRLREKFSVARTLKSTGKGKQDGREAWTGSTEWTVF